MYDEFRPDPGLTPRSAQDGPDPVPHRRRPVKKKGGWMGKLALGIGLVALGAACFNLYLSLSGGAEKPSALPDPVTFQYRDMTLEAKEGLPVNQYGLDGFYTDGQGRTRYTRDGVQARLGIDVSFYQKEVDWQAVAADGVEFVLIRLGYRGYTEGGLNLDSRYQENLRGALEAGLEVGVYFFSQAITPQEAEEEARFVLDALAGQTLDYPVVFDWEPIAPGKDARTDGLDGQTLTQCAAAFCETIDQAGYTPAVYFNQDQGYLTYDLAQLSRYTFWLADYDSAPDFYYHFDLWQYTHSGTVAGIQNHVDLNLDFGPVNAP